MFIHSISFDIFQKKRFIVLSKRLHDDDCETITTTKGEQHVRSCFVQNCKLYANLRSSFSYSSFLLLDLLLLYRMRFIGSLRLCGGERTEMRKSKERKKHRTMKRPTFCEIAWNLIVGWNAKSFQYFSNFKIFFLEKNSFFLMNN